MLIYSFFSSRDFKLCLKSLFNNPLQARGKSAVKSGANGKDAI
jgi:hypothetical protein